MVWQHRPDAAGRVRFRCHPKQGRPCASVEKQQDLADVPRSMTRVGAVATRVQGPTAWTSGWRAAPLETVRCRLCSQSTSWFVVIASCNITQEGSELVPILDG